MHDPLPSRRARTAAAIGCALLLAIFALLSGSAVLTKSPTADEPLHSMSAYTRRFLGDFRVNTEDPPLFGYFAMLPHNARTLKIDTTTPEWRAVLEYFWSQWHWCAMILYHTAGNDPEMFINRSRMVMLILGVALGIVLARWSWKLAGPLAAVVAATLFCFDPGFLGHSPLVKNDVPITLALFSAMMACWSVGRRARWWNILLLALLSGIAVNTKFSGVIIGPMVALALFARALMPHSWIVLNRELRHRISKCLAVACIGIVCTASCIAVTWASYGFRYRPTPHPDARLNMPLIVDATVNGLEAALFARENRAATEQERAAFRNSTLIHTILWLDQHKILPQGWLAGFLHTYATTRKRITFLNGEVRDIGRWTYFPLAMLYKTPTATLAAVALAIVAAIALRKRSPGRGLDHWSLICIAVPLVIYGFSALRSPFNIGVRHVFPLYPFIFLLVAVVAARAFKAAPRAAGWTLALLAVGLIVESSVRYPNYIAFFNAPAGGPIGGFRLLSDSNLDWGQDLNLLREWQRQNPDRRLYVSYFGMAEPGYYVKYTPLPGNASTFVEPTLPDEPGVAALSASHMQGIFVDRRDHARYIVLRHMRKPIAVLGGTIYLYEVPAAKDLSSNSKWPLE